jgi:thiol:disulfide interchange protein
MKRDANRPAWVIVFVVAGLIALVGVSRLRGGKELVPWREDWEAGRAEARAGGKPVLVYFTAAWCGPCQEMKRTTWADARVAEALAGYVPIRIDIDKQAGLAAEYHVQSIPTMALIDEQGRVVRETGGYTDAAEFVSWLKG